MPTISFDTIEHSDVTGLETTRHEYVIREEGTKSQRVHYYKDGIFQCFYYGKESYDLIDSFIHEKTTTKKTTAKTTRTTESEAVATDRRRPHLVCGGQGGESKNDIKNPVQTNIFDQKF